MNSKNIITFLDNAQRTIIGELTSETPVSMEICNPVVVNVVPQYNQAGQPTGQMALQLLPIFFKEFLGDRNSDVNYTYLKNCTTRITFAGGFDFKLYAQYEFLFKKEDVVSNIPVNQDANSPVVKLFDE